MMKSVLRAKSIGTKVRDEEYKQLEAIAWEELGSINDAKFFG